MDMAENVYIASQPGGEGLEALEGAPPNALNAGTLGYISNREPEGIAITKAMAAALNVMIKNGEYAAIIKKWKIPEEAEMKEAFAN